MLKNIKVATIVDEKKKKDIPKPQAKGIIKSSGSVTVWAKYSPDGKLNHR